MKESFDQLKRLQPELQPLEPIVTINKEIAQVNYLSGENVITYRMAKGSADISGDYHDYPTGDISGDSNIYTTNGTKTVNGKEITLKGTDDLVKLAI